LNIHGQAAGFDTTLAENFPNIPTLFCLTGSEIVQFAAGQETPTGSPLTDRNPAQAAQRPKARPTSQLNKAALHQKTIPQL